MKTKNLMVSFVAFAMALFLVATVSAVATSGDLDVSNVAVKVDGLYVSSNPAVTAGDTIAVEVKFTADMDASEVIVKAELDDVVAKTSKFDIEETSRYSKTLTLEVPYDLKDELSDDIELEITIEGEDSDGDDVEAELETITLTVQRPTYDIDFKSVNVDQSVEAGQTFPVEVVLKNIGYNDLEDLYITASIPALGVEKTSYAGDLVADEWEYDDDDDDETDTFSGRIYLTVPYGVEAGIYTLEVAISNDDMDINEVKQIVVKNDFADPVIKSGNDLIIVNPTESVKAYTIIVEAPATVSEGVVVVPAGSSRTVTVSANAEGAYDFNVNVLSGSEIVSTVSFSGEDDASASSPVVVLTVVLAIIFLVLLVVLIVLIGKKPEKTEEFGESYY